MPAIIWWAFIISELKMNDDALSKAIEKITTAIKGRGDNSISGALLGELIIAETPEINVREVVNIPTGSGALRKFIDIHLAHLLSPSHKHGSDMIYSIIESNSSKSEEIDPDLWRTFVHINSSKVLVLRGSVLQTEDIKKLNLIDEESIKINSLTTDELNKIRIDFVTALGNVGDGLLNMDASYADWSLALRKLGREHYRSWTEYRLRKIEELFSQRLTVQEIDPKIQQDLVKLIRRSQLSRKKINGLKKVDVKSPKVLVINEQVSAVEIDDLKFRSAILEVIEKLSMSELRTLKLPAGEFADALKRQYSK